MRNVWALILGLSFMFIQCSGESGLIDPMGAKTFWTTKFLGNNTWQPKAVPTLFRGKSTHANVYVSFEVSLSQDFVNRVLSSFEASIVPVEHRVFSAPMDIDNDGKVNIIIFEY